DVPDPTDPATFAAARLDWSERNEGVHARALAFYRSLLALRRALPDLTDGRRDRTADEVDVERRVVVVHRERTAAAVNLSPEPATATVQGHLLLRSDDEVTVAADGTVRLPAWGVAVLDT